MRRIRHENVADGRPLMRYRWASAVLVLATALLTASCQLPWSAKPSTTTIKELAGALAGSGDDVARWEDELLAANGGRASIDAKIAKELQARPAVLTEIWDETDEVRGLACDAWTNGVAMIDSSAATTLPGLEAQNLLNDMRADTAAGRAAVDSVTFACELAGIEL